MRTSSGCRSATLSERATTMTIRRLSLAAALGLALVAVGCHNDELFTPLVPAYKGGAMFVRYVAMGNSITAGFQSGGINDTTQLQSYVRRVANAMGAPYYYPQLVYPGCPPPFTNIFTNTRLLGGTATTCYYRATPIPPFLTNVAVPSAEVIDILHNGPFVPGTNSNPLTQLMLGGRTQIQAKYQEVVDSIKAANAQAILIGVANVTEIPFVSQGATYWAIRNGLVPGQPGDTFPSADSLFHVDPLCAPSALGGKGDSVLVPFPFGGALLAAAQAGVDDTLHCTEPQTVQPAELVKIVTTVAAYNAFISSAASTNGWAYFDPAPALDSLRGIPTQVAPFPNFGFPCSSSPFGLAFSCDGFHPSSATHLLIAKKLVQTINTKYSSAIPSP